MASQITQRLFFLRSELLYKKGIDKGEIKPFSEAIYNQMNNAYLGGVPISLLLKIALATNVVGECYAESLYMFLCFPDSFLVRGDLKSISYANNGSSGGHGWVEMNNRVYDPTLGYEFTRELYYKIHGANNIRRYTKDDYIAQSPQNATLYQQMTTTTKRDIETTPIKQLELHILVAGINSSLENISDDNLKREWADYLESVGFNPMDNPAIKVLRQTSRRK